MKKICFVLISILLSLSFCSCHQIYFDGEKEQTAYQETIDSLFTALDEKDQDAIYYLFSPAAREQDKDMKEKIQTLFSVYQGSTDEIGWDGLLASTGDYEYGKKRLEAYNTFPVCSGDTYFWFYLKIMYENSFDQNQIGITQLEFYTADEYYLFRCVDEAKIKDRVGLFVYADKITGEDLRCLHGWPHKYSTSTNPLDIDDVKNFFQSQNSFSTFQETFGPPNAAHIYHYYSLSSENEKSLYLEIDTDGDIIYHASVVDDFSYIETLYDKEE